MLSQKLLEILCCPKCHGDLLYEPEKEKLTCKKCGKVYEIRNGVPVMLVEEDKPGK